VRFHTKETEQYHLALGGLGIARGDERRFAMRILDTILGGSTSSRLFQEVREKRGLAYSVYSYTSQYADTGQVAVYVGTRPDNVQEAMTVIGTELTRLQSDGVTAAELDRARENVKGRTVLSMESSASRMNRLGSSVLMGVPVLTVDELLARLDAVTLDDVAQLARDVWLPERMSAAGVGGDEGTFRSALEAVNVPRGSMFLQFLPLAHSLGRLEHFLAFDAMAVSSFARSLQTVAEDLAVVRPEIMVSVPRLYEKFYARVLAKVEEDGGLKKAIFEWALGVGRESAVPTTESEPPRLHAVAMYGALPVVGDEQRRAYRPRARSPQARHQLDQPARLEGLDVVVEEEQQLADGDLRTLVAAVGEALVVGVGENRDREWRLDRAQKLERPVAGAVVDDDQLQLARVLGAFDQPRQQPAQVLFPVAVEDDDRDEGGIGELGQ